MMYLSLDRERGGTLSDAAHIKQSVKDILITPIGSRVMRRDYGSMLSEMIDDPTSEAMNLQLTVAIYGALSRWESRISISSINLRRTPDGIEVDLDATRTDTGVSASLSVNLGGTSANS